MPLEATDVRVHMTQISRVKADKSLFWIKSQGQDVLDVLIGKSSKSLQIFSITFIEIFFIISDLNNERHIEGLLHPLTEDKRQHMT